MENLYAIIAAKTLTPGPNQLQHVEHAIYVCGDHIRNHANYYMRYVPLCQDGVFWAVKWEVSVDRNRKFASSKANQWLQRPGRVVLEALWVSGKTYQCMSSDDQVQLAWYPHLEVRPSLQMPDATKGLPTGATLPLPSPSAASSSTSPLPPPPPPPAFQLGAAQVAVSKTKMQSKPGMARPAKLGMARPAKTTAPKKLIILKPAPTKKTRSFEAKGCRFDARGQRKGSGHVAGSGRSFDAHGQRKGSFFQAPGRQRGTRRGPWTRCVLACCS